MLPSAICDSGLSVVYEPEHGVAVVDIILVHGLQGHPHKTWASTKLSKKSESQAGGDEQKKPLHRVLSLRLQRPTGKLTPEGQDASHAVSSSSKPQPVFWPFDLLPRECPKSRILVYGYDTKITKYLSGATNRNSVFSHGKDLLFALTRERQVDRPLIIVAHSLGGIIVKEMLASSSLSTEKNVRNIIESTAAVIFMGTPHRGSPDLASLGEWMRIAVSTLRMETSSVILDTLGLKTSDLERAQESFSGLWQQYDFRVKTFQEGLGLTGVNLGVLGNKVVPDYSSLIGDPREHAESLQANHMDMCRFTGADDPNYRKVSGEIRAAYASLVALNTRGVHRDGLITRASSVLSKGSSKRASAGLKAGDLSETEKACLQALWFPSIHTGGQNIERPAAETCNWLFQHELYLDWFHGRNQDEHCGLLWIKGKPGAGKSTLMKEAFRLSTTQNATADCCSAAFFFSAKGDELERSPLGLFRSLQYQLLPRYREHLGLFTKTWLDKKAALGDASATTATCDASDLRSLFCSLEVQQSAKRILIFVDALDECNLEHARSVAYFWREVTRSAHASGVHLSVLLSSRHFPSITVSNCPEIIVESHNAPDIATYVERKFQLGIAHAEPQWELLMENVLKKAGGVFLWVALVVNGVLREWDEGVRLQSLLKHLDTVPDALEALFSQMIFSLSPKDKQLAARFFQWAILSVKPLRLHEWHHVLGFIRSPTPPSLQEWRKSDHFTETDEQLERQIRSISKGLVEVKARSEEPPAAKSDSASVCAGAGSLDLEHGETRIVQVIHESVREFFLKSNGFAILDPILGSNPTGLGHLSIMATCLDYLNIKELDALVKARTKVQEREKVQVLEQVPIAPRPKLNRRRSSPTPFSGKEQQHKRTLSVNDHSVTSRAAKQRKTIVYHVDTHASGSFNAPYTTYEGGSSPVGKSYAVYHDGASYYPRRPGSVASFGSAGSHDGKDAYNFYGWQQRDSYSQSPYGQPGYTGYGSTRRRRGPTHNYGESSDDGESAPRRNQPRENEGSVYESLKRFPEPNPSENISKWRSASQTGAEQGEAGPALSSSTRPSVTGQSQVLEAYAALLSYATFEFFTHSRLAEAESVDPGIIIRRLQERKTWARWVTLREDLPQDTGLIYYAADQGLESWIGSICSSSKTSLGPSLVEAVRKRNNKALEVIMRHSDPGKLYEDPQEGPILHMSTKASDVTLLQTYLHYAITLLGGEVLSGQITALLDAKDKAERTALHIATTELCYDVALELLERGANVNATGWNGLSPLHIACSLEPESGAAEAGEHASETPESRQIGMVGLLLEHGADINAKDSLGATPLHVACWKRRDAAAGDIRKVEIIRQLLDKGAFVNAAGNKGETPLHIASLSTDQIVVAELLSRGADVKAVDCSGRTPLHIAAHWSSEEVVAFLLAHAAEVEPKDQQGCTPLHFACNPDNPSNSRDKGLGVIRQLVDHGADARTIKNDSGWSALDIAVHFSFNAAVALLNDKIPAPLVDTSLPKPTVESDVEEPGRV